MCKKIPMTQHGFCQSYILKISENSQESNCAGVVGWGQNFNMKSLDLLAFCLCAGDDEMHALCII